MIATITPTADVQLPAVVMATVEPTDTEMAAIASEINHLHVEVVGAAKSQLAGAFRLGQLLNDVKDRVGHGWFIPWIAKNCDFSPRCANHYMRLFAKYGTAERLKEETGVSGLSLRRAIALTRDRGRTIKRAERSAAEPLVAVEREVHVPVNERREVIHDAEIVEQADEPAHDPETMRVEQGDVDRSTLDACSMEIQLSDGLFYGYIEADEGAERVMQFVRRVAHYWPKDEVGVLAETLRLLADELQSSTRGEA